MCASNWLCLTDATVYCHCWDQRGFLARGSSDEDVVSTVACAVETTIDASAVVCGGST
jgi:hypothetical protein